MIFFDGSRVRSITFGEREVLNVYYEGVQVFNTTALSNEETEDNGAQSDILEEGG